MNVAVTVARRRPGTVLLALFLCACGNGRPSLPSPLVVEVTGRDLQWHFRYPGPDLRLGTADDPVATHDLHLPAQVRTRLEFRSEDGLYFFECPDLGIQKVAVPDIAYALEIEPGSTGTFDILGDQMCSAFGPESPGSVVVEAMPEFVAWLNQLDRATPSVARGD